MRQCAFLTLEDRSDFCIYDHLLVDPLAKIGWTVEDVPWDRPGVHWAAFDAVIVRSTWDYQNHPTRFIDTLEIIARQTKLFNPVSVCRWNLSKGYLEELSEHGIAVVPTVWPDRLTETGIREALTHFATDTLVAKLLVGANADNAFVLTRDDELAWNAALRVFDTRPVMLQPFLNNIKTEGEYSLFYFAGAFSHAIVKRPATGDFRVQEEHGGIIRSCAPGDELLQAGQAALAAVGEKLLYARVDLVRLDDGEPVLMELELIEPSLYFEQCPEAAQRFVRAFQDMLAG